MGMKLKCFVLLGFSFLIKMKNHVKTDFIHLCFENVTVKYFAFHETMQTVFHKSFFSPNSLVIFINPKPYFAFVVNQLLSYLMLFPLMIFLCIPKHYLPPLSLRSFPVTYSFCRPRNGRRGKKDKKDRVSVGLPLTFVLSFRLCGDSLFSV